MTAGTPDPTQEHREKAREWMEGLGGELLDIIPVDIQAELARDFARALAEAEERGRGEAWIEKAGYPAFYEGFQRGAEAMREQDAKIVRSYLTPAGSWLNSTLSVIVRQIEEGPLPEEKP